MVLPRTVNNKQANIEAKKWKSVNYKFCYVKGRHISGLQSYIRTRSDYILFLISDCPEKLTAPLQVLHE